MEFRKGRKRGSKNKGRRNALLAGGAIGGLGAVGLAARYGAAGVGTARNLQGPGLTRRERLGAGLRASRSKMASDVRGVGSLAKRGFGAVKSAPGALRNQTGARTAGPDMARPYGPIEAPKNLGKGKKGKGRRGDFS
jgi:hypothetical protein